MYQKSFQNTDVSNKKVLITGGAGFIGSNIAEYLLLHHAKVVVLDNLATGKQENIEPFFSNPNFRFIEGDIRDFDTCKNACIGIDIICHQAAIGSVPRSVKDPITTNNVNIGGFVNMLFAAKEAGIKRFVYASSSSVYGDEKTLPKKEERIGKPLSPYAVTKYTNEVYADVFSKTYGMEIIGLRYFNIFGPKQDPYGEYAAVMPLFIKALLNNEAPFVNGDGEQTRDFTYIHNAVQANILAMTTTNNQAFNNAYNIAVGGRFSINYMYEAIQKYLHKDIKAIHREARVGDIRDSQADISKAQELLNYQPNYTFEEGLSATIAYFKSIFNF
ncbi:MAG: SDR family oxidoreductase [Bacteroidetes bacterium]|nr:SDR family oxidoreductase [Bacteroidota bacterium]